MNTADVLTIVFLPVTIYLFLMTINSLVKLLTGKGHLSVTKKVIWGEIIWPISFAGFYLSYFSSHFSIWILSDKFINMLFLILSPIFAFFTWLFILVIITALIFKDAVIIKNKI